MMLPIGCRFPKNKTKTNADLFRMHPGDEQGEHTMFKVKNLCTGKIETVYAIQGNMFLVYNTDTDDPCWMWLDMDFFQPVED